MKASLRDVTISAPLLFSAPSSNSEAPCHVQCNMDLESGRLEITSGSGGNEITHLQAWHAGSPSTVTTGVDGSQNGCVEHSGSTLLRSVGCAHAPLNAGSEMASATAGVTSINALASSGYKVDPAALDSGLQLGAVVPSSGRHAQMVRVYPLTHQCSL